MSERRAGALRLRLEPDDLGGVPGGLPGRGLDRAGGLPVPPPRPVASLRLPRVSPARAASRTALAVAASDPAASASRRASVAAAAATASSATTRSISACRSRRPSGRPSETTIGPAAALPSRTTADQPGARRACRSTSDATSGTQTTVATILLTAPAGSARTASSSRPPPTATAASTVESSTRRGGPAASRSSTATAPRSAARPATSAAGTTKPRPASPTASSTAARKAGSTTSPSSIRRPPRRRTALAIGRASSSSSRTRRVASRAVSSARRASLPAARSTCSCRRTSIRSRSRPGGFARLDGGGLRRHGDGERHRAGRPPGFGIGEQGRRSLRLDPLLGRPALHVGRPPASRLELGGPDRGGPPARRQFLVGGRPGVAKRGELGHRLGERPLRFGQVVRGDLIRREDRLGERPSLADDVGLGDLAFRGETDAIAPERLELAAETGLLDPQLGDARPGGIVGRPTLAFRSGPVAEGGRHRCRHFFGSHEVGHRAIRCRASPGEGPAGRPGSRTRLVPAGMGRGEERRRELLAGRPPGGLLIGLGGEPASLRPELAEDVLDAGEVGLRLGELFLRPLPPSLVAADPGDLLEEWATLLRPEGEGLVDHALADEEEGVVGEVGRVQEVDEVAEADPLLVEQVIVLAGAVQAPADLEDAVVEGEQPVGIVDDEGHVGHPGRRSPLRAGEDHVLALPRPERAALLAEGPAKGIGEVALARSVGPDDGADPAVELDERPLGERLESLEPEAEEPRRAAHPTISGSDRSMPSRAIAAAAVSAMRRDGPTPVAEDAPTDEDLDPERLLVVGPRRVEHPVLGSLPAGPLGVLLEAALRALQARRRRVVGQLRGCQRHDPVARPVEPEVEVQRPADRLEGRGEEGRAAAAATGRLALAEKEGVAEIDPAGETGEAGRRDDRRPAGGQEAFVVGRVAGVDRLADGQVHDGVTEVLEPFVVGRRRVRVLVQMTAVDEGLVEEIRVADLETEAGCERVRRTHTHGARDSVARTSARRCTRPRHRRCGSSRHPRRRSPSRTPLRDS